MHRQDAEGRWRREELAVWRAQGAGPGHADGQQSATSLAGSVGRPAAAYIETLATEQRKSRGIGHAGHRTALASWRRTRVPDARGSGEPSFLALSLSWQHRAGS